jgi:two-component system CheB/CheR fusion protein
MVFQPQIDLESGLVVGAESLLRWRDPHLGEMSPAMFIPVAESAGLMVRLGDLVFNMVFDQISKWIKAGRQVPRISINASVHQFRDAGFVDRVMSISKQHEVPLSQVTIEITESALADRLEQIEAMLRQLEAQGATISIDDFGTGYSSLSYLKRLPIHELKVDRSFVDGIAVDSDDQAISMAIISMAHSLGMHVVAEGVENSEQRDALVRMGCEIAQGYFYHRPLEVINFTEILPMIQGESR